jgi:hypothetical protein
MKSQTSWEDAVSVINTKSAEIVKGVPSLVSALQSPNLVNLTFVFDAVVWIEQATLIRWGH